MSATNFPDVAHAVPDRIMSAELRQVHRYKVQCPLPDKPPIVLIDVTLAYGSKCFNVLQSERKFTKRFTNWVSTTRLGQLYAEFDTLMGTAQAEFLLLYLRVSQFI